MSTHEYNDLFLKCQNTGIYHVFTFDIKGSKKMSATVRQIAQYKLVKLNLLMYQEIQKIEQKENKKILVFEEDFIKFGEVRKVRKNVFGYKQEPFLIGDVIGFTVYRDTITNDEVIKIYEKYRKILGIDFEFHIADGYYETNKYEEGNKKYFRGYCIDLLSNLHKEYNKEVRKVLEKQKRFS